MQLLLQTKTATTPKSKPQAHIRSSQSTVIFIRCIRYKKKHNFTKRGSSSNTNTTNNSLLHVSKSSGAYPRSVSPLVGFHEGDDEENNEHGGYVDTSVIGSVKGGRVYGEV